jgi:hypothetical protein
MAASNFEQALNAQEITRQQDHQKLSRIGPLRATDSGQQHTILAMEPVLHERVYCVIVARKSDSIQRHDPMGGEFGSYASFDRCSSNRAG